MTNGNYYLIATVKSRKWIKSIEHTFVESTLWNPDKKIILALSMKLVMEPENHGRIPFCVKMKFLVIVQIFSFFGCEINRRCKKENSVVFSQYSPYT